MAHPTLSKRRRNLAGRAAALCAALSLLAGCSLLPNEEEPLDPPALTSKAAVHETSPVTRGNMELYLSSTASAVSEVNQTVSFPESGGILKKLYVSEGDTVKAGAPIAELDTGDLPIRLKLQELTVEQRSLRYQDAVKQDSDKDAIALAKIDLEADRLQLNALKEQYRKALLFAPADGLVTYLNDLKPGEAVEANVAMAVVSDPAKVNFVYDATDATKIRSVQKGAEVALTLDKKSYAGSVIQTPATAPKSDDDAVNRRNAKSLVIALKDAGAPVQIGTYADFKLFIEKRDNVLIIPREALKTMFGRDYVETIENSRVKEVDIEAGLKTSNQVEVLKGLEEGQGVVIDN
ncbi:efflux RND transporter periplasmic adaptor subunit [Paenibacillus glycinis]|uniref:HlyD family efflux transporter periplasmic adaptor subunit n=1 Tax=Paenibacillus glycinis TaxID=2697035 RepID=A0ABW9XMG1_9BACL|nr:HlyD family efflux transporter periplasmic adaptor subunit [Paenibacillus glycinis]NBD23795.1 HlyD family efflux transporter periplasmic adaptor subunit [Paenibacillus glycinis]